MMGNKWVQAGLFMGIAVGIYLGAVLVLLVGPWALLFGMAAGFASMYVASNARGTDGMGGPYRGPKRDPSLSPRPDID